MPHCRDAASTIPYSHNDLRSLEALTAGLGCCGWHQAPWATLPAVSPLLSGSTNLSPAPLGEECCNPAQQS